MSYNPGETSRFPVRDPENIIPPHFPSPSDITPTHSHSPATPSPSPSHHSSTAPRLTHIHDENVNTTTSNSFTFDMRFQTLEEKKILAQKQMEKFSEDTQNCFSALLSCDDKYCSNYREVYDHTQLSLWEDVHKESYDKWHECCATGQERGVCQRIFDFGEKKTIAVLEEVLKNQRLIHPNPLVDYDGLVYQSPFWFEGAGEVWRKTDHSSKRLGLTVCKKLRKDVEQCLLDRHEEGSTDFCYRQFQHSLICEPGLNCPYLRFPMMQCFRKIQGIDYVRFRACVKLVPNYASCKFSPDVPQWSLHNFGKSLPDLTEFQNPSGMVEFTQFDENGDRLPPIGFYIPDNGL